MSDFFLADDLSGALDAAAAFHRAGWPVTIALSAETWPAESRGGVVGLTTETRNAAPVEAADKVTQAIAQGRRRGGRLLYKKIDSTLRGPVAAELGALAAALPEMRLLFCPANPAAGRTVRGGVVRVGGVPVAETEFGRDPASPVKESEIRRLLGAAATGRVTIPDATDEADLAAAVARMDATGGDWVGIGSGALARPIAARWPGAGDRPGAAAGDPAPGPVLMVCGSAHPQNRVQAAALARGCGVEVHEFQVANPAEALAGATVALCAGRGAALIVEERRGDRAAIAGLLAKAVAGLVAKTGVRRVFLTGGETAFALCRALGVSSLTFEGEIEAGLSLSRANLPDGVLRLAIKPGGFGDAATWVRAWQRLIET
jgi:uncharacterized protein YgbK (DUF1537 family)